jgi:hypothetical protein
MFTIPIQVTGDAWNNRTQVKELLDQTHPGQSVILDLFSEGPSLQKLGVVDLVDQYNLNVYVTRWCNGVENVSYYKNKCNSQSHFFPMAQHYWTESIDNMPTTEYRFGLFLGRDTYSRNRILYDAAHQWPDYFLLSKMKSIHGPHKHSPNELENLTEWFGDIPGIQHWIDTCSIGSIDNHVIQDQYKLPEVSAGNMAKSLFQHYSRFNVELICESYTLGNAFFPTEKTVRPIVGNKPFIVYGPKNYLNNLREQEGFQTFNSIWNEDYDQLEGVPRWQAISQLIDSLILQGKEQWADTIQQASVITQHNRKILEKIINDRKKL